MNLEYFIQQLKDRLTQPLPGEAEQLKMAPSRRLTFKEYYEQGMKNARQSAVLVCLYPFQESIFTVLTLRPSEFGIHSDQVSFPGGQYEEIDTNLEMTALRETYEELGIKTSSLAVIGKLTPLYIPVSNYMVHPFVAICQGHPIFALNKHEVKQIIETEVTIFLRAEIKGHGFFFSGSKVQIDAPFYEVQQHRIWGATAMIISELEAILRPFLTHT